MHYIAFLTTGKARGTSWVHKHKYSKHTFKKSSQSLRENHRLKFWCITFCWAVNWRIISIATNGYSRMCICITFHLLPQPIPQSKSHFFVALCIEHIRAHNSERYKRKEKKYRLFDVQNMASFCIFQHFFPEPEKRFLAARSRIWFLGTASRFVNGFTCSVPRKIYASN